MFPNTHQKPMMYNNPIGGKQSSIGHQQNLYERARPILIDLLPQQKYSIFASTEVIPPHYGTTIVKEVELPILDDRNVNDQGIDRYGNIIPNGNFFGSNRDIDFVDNNMPYIGELGGRVNRIGMHRTKITGSMQELGFFMEFSKRSLLMDSDAQLEDKALRQMLITANRINEYCIQRDLIANANNVVFPGAALQTADIGADNIINYSTLCRLDESLNAVNAPKEVEMIKGSVFTDTRVVPQCRYLIAPEEIRYYLESMTDNFGRPVFKPVESYAAGATYVHPHEVGAIGSFRILLDQTMLIHKGKGQPVQANQNIRTTNGNADVFNLLCLCKDAFSIIGFQLAPNSGEVRFQLEESDFKPSHDDPYATRKLKSISWWYGFLAIRPEWIGLIQTALPNTL